MKQPKIDDLKVNREETKKIRSRIAKSKKIKITINVEVETLKELRRLAEEKGASYQKLLNQILKSGLSEKQNMESRVERLEKELERIKRKMAA